jgi:hypothetical protein
MFTRFGSRSVLGRYEVIDEHILIWRQRARSSEHVVPVSLPGRGREDRLVCFWL